MVTIAEFLTARLDEDEATAQVEQIEIPPSRNPDGSWMTVPGRPKPGDARALADIAAKRALLELHAPSGNECRTCCGEPYIEEHWDGEAETTEWKRADLSFPCPTTRILASAYADHPDYRQEWKP